MSEQQIRGIRWAMMAAVISGVSVFANGLVVKGIDPLVHNVVKNGLVGMAVLLIAIRYWKPETGMAIRKNWRKLVAIAIIGGGIPFWLFFAGLKIIGGVEGAIIHKSLIIWVALMAMPLLKEKVPLKMWMAIGLLYGSNWLNGFSGFKAVGIGHLMVLVATLMWAGENIIAKKALSEVPVNMLVAARMFGGAVILGMILLSSGKGGLLIALTDKQWLMLTGVAVLLLAYVMSWYRALRVLPATMTAGMLVGATVITTVLDAVLVKHSYNGVILGQVVLVVSGVYWALMAGMEIWRKERKQSKKAVI